MTTARPDRLRVVMASASEMLTDARVCREAASLARAGYAVTILCLKSSRPVELEGVQLVELDVSRAHRAIRLLASLVLLTLRMLRMPAHVYHAHNVHMLPAAWLAARLRRARVIYDAHELWSIAAPMGRSGQPSMKQRLERFVERRLAPRCDRILTVSPRYAAHIASALKVSPPVELPNCPPLPPLHIEASPLRDRSGAEEDDILILYQGGYYLETRALDVLIQALKYLPDRYRLVLLGFGVDGEEQVLAQWISDCGVDDRARMLPPVSHSDLPAWTAGADIGAIPFRIDSLVMKLCSPNKLYEYLQAGLPVLASAADELVEVLEETKAGATYDFSDPKDFAARVLELGSSREELRSVGMRGRRAAEAKYSWERIEDRLLRAYGSLEPSLTPTGTC